MISSPLISRVTVLFVDLFERKGYVDDGEFDWTGRTMSTPVSWWRVLSVSYQLFDCQQVTTQDPISPSGRGRHNTGKDGGKGTPAWSESKPSGIDILGGRLGDNRHPSVQVHRSVRTSVQWPEDRSNMIRVQGLHQHGS